MSMTLMRTFDESNLDWCMSRTLGSVTRSSTSRLFCPLYGSSFCSGKGKAMSATAWEQARSTRRCAGPLGKNLETADLRSILHYR